MSPLPEFDTFGSQSPRIEHCLSEHSNKYRQITSNRWKDILIPVPKSRPPVLLHREIIVECNFLSTKQSKNHYVAKFMGFVWEKVQ